MCKSEVTVFGEQSNAHVERKGLFTYAVVRDLDGVILCKGFRFRKYRGDIIRTLYTGEAYGTGDFVLRSDRCGDFYVFK